MAIAPASESCRWPRPTRMTARSASQRALQLQACSYSSLRSILKRSLERANDGWSWSPASPGRGTRTYAVPTLRSTHDVAAVNHNCPERNHMLNQPTIEKLHTMKLHGMADAFRAQIENRRCQPTRLRGALRNARRSAMALKEKRALAATLAVRQAGKSACDRRYRLPASARARSQLLRTLSASEWVRQNQNVLLIDRPVSAKRLACALARKLAAMAFRSASADHGVVRELAVALWTAASEE